MSGYEITGADHGIAYLTAPYALLVEAFGNDGINPRDTYKQMCQWDSASNAAVDPNGLDGWEVYDYKVGTCYDKRDGQAREEITTWHVQATETGEAKLIELLDAAVRRLTLPEIYNELLEADEAESFEEACRKANGEGAEPPFSEQCAPSLSGQIEDMVNELGDGGTVRIGEQDVDGFFTGAGLEISLEGVRAGVGEYEYGELTSEILAPLNLDEVRKAHALLGAYLAIVDQADPQKWPGTES